MSHICTSIATFLANQPALRIYEYLNDEVETEAHGREVMTWLGIHRVDVRNSVLCYLDQVCCYQLGHSDYAAEEPLSDHDKWFVSVTVGTPLEHAGVVEKLPLFDSCEAAESGAVEAFGLVDKFFQAFAPSPALH